MTEDEAKTKICCGPAGCGTRVLDDSRLSGVACLCVASACMAWRWDKVQPDQTLNEWAKIPVSKTSGHCGLTHD